MSIMKNLFCFICGLLFTKERLLILLLRNNFVLIEKALRWRSIFIYHERFPFCESFTSVQIGCATILEQLMSSHKLRDRALVKAKKSRFCTTDKNMCARLYELYHCRCVLHISFISPNFTQSYLVFKSNNFLYIQNQFFNLAMRYYIYFRKEIDSFYWV